MPDRPLSENVSTFINFMRAFKHKYPKYEHVSRRIFYPFISPYYQKWKTHYLANYSPSPSNMIKSLRAWFV